MKILRGNFCQVKIEITKQKNAFRHPSLPSHLEDPDLLQGPPPHPLAAPPGPHPGPVGLPPI